MWESITTMVTSKALIPVLVFVLILVGVAIFAIKKGWLKIKTDKVQVGSDNERNIIMTQMSKIESVVMSVYKKWGFANDNWKARYICSEIEDALYRAVAVNHINTNRTYVSLKQELLWKIICQYTDNPPDDLKEKVYAETEKLIADLVEIRDYFQNRR
jgi:hypothetical protein